MAEFVDIAPALLEKLQAAFAAKLEQSSHIAALREAMQKGNSYVPVENYAAEVGELLAETLREHLSSAVLPDGRLYYNIADKVLRPLLETDRKLVSDAAVQTLNRMHEAAGIGVRAQPAPEDAKRVNDLLNLAAHTETYDDVAGTVEQAAVTYSQSVADETLKRNVDFIGRSGRRPKIIRTATSHCCEWCQKLAGTYEYPVENENVYRRHSDCRCTVEYDPGGAKRFQNVHNKEWKTAEERAKIEARKQVGVSSLAHELAEHPLRLAAYTPTSLKQALEDAGFETKPLKQGSLKNIPFEEGGGFKVNFEDGGLLQYHPKKKSHHGGAYYKISTGKGGTKRYDLDGTEKRDEK